MRKAIVAFLAGLGISFLGSIPFGYLNIIAFNIHTQNGIASLYYFLLGIITIECPVIFLTFKFVEKIGSNHKFTKKLEIASLFFLITLTLITIFAKGNDNVVLNYSSNYHNTFIAGMLLNAANFLQYPFWSGWGLYIINNNIIKRKDRNIGLFISGAAIGTIGGMIVFVLLLSQISSHFHKITDNITVLIFLSLILFQLFRIYKRYLST